MEAIELRKKKIELQNEIHKLIKNFILDVGDCEISIDVESIKITNSFGGEQYAGKQITVDVTV
jgi:hypothetical protein